MRFPKKALFFLGWLIFYVSTQILTVPLVQYIFSYLEKIYHPASMIVPLAIVYITYFIIGFISFVVSIRFVIIPPYQNRKIIPAETVRTNLVSYFLKWLEYLAYYLSWCSPLIVRFGFPYEDIARFVWQLIAGYGVYNSVVRSWVEGNHTYNQQDRENRSATIESI